VEHVLNLQQRIVWWNM